MPGSGALPGNNGSDYVYPNPDSSAYFIGKGMTTFRLPFRWERLQRSLNGGLDSTELGRLRNTVNGITGRGAAVILDPARPIAGTSC